MRQSDSIGEMPKVDVVERVARAICRAMWGDDCPLMTAAAFEEEHWSQTLAEARAAIAAMREPTEAMVAAATHGPPSGPVLHPASVRAPRAVWRAMVDAALAQPPASTRGA